MRIRVALACALLAMVPSLVSGQQTAGVIAGVVRDATGGVLPGVTVEVASPALIERVRSVVTGDDGQYRVVELRPGEYSITFTLTGFGKLARENVQITSGFTATVNAELKVGDMEETITVTGGSPVVDLQNVTQQAVLGKVVLDSIPSGRSYTAIGKLVAGIDASGSSGGNDVGGSQGRDATKLIYHGSATNAFKLMIDGMPQMTWIADGSVGVPPADNVVEEINLQYSGLPAEYETGGVAYNMVPKSGSNTYKTSFFSNVATGAMQSDNLSDHMRAKGFTKGETIDYVTEVTPAFGGPLKQDRLWFFVTYRDFRPYISSPMFYDSDKNDFLYTADTSIDPALDAKPQKALNSRITWQFTPRNRLNLGLEVSKIKLYNRLVGGRVGNISAPESTANATIKQTPVMQLSWTAPLNNRLLIDVGGQVFRGRWTQAGQKDISVPVGAIEQSTGIQFRSPAPLGSTGLADIPFWHDYIRGAVSYTTGSHAIKVGGNLWHGGLTNILDDQGFGPYTVRLLNGTPSFVNYRVAPNNIETRFVKGSFFGQDQWTLNRLTINYGLRIDTQDSGYPAQHEVATRYFPARDFDGGKVIQWRDWSPRSGVAFDLFGNGKTAIKAAFSRYVNWDATALADAVNPAGTSGGTLLRSWNDQAICAGCVSRDFIPQGDPTNPLANGEIGPSPNANWGTPIINTRYDPEWSHGWGVRDYSTEKSVSLQQELRSNVAMNIGYFYRGYGNFTVVDNLATTPADYDTFCISAPADSRLPGGGGNRICGLFDLKPASVGRVDNFRTLAKNYGKVDQNYKGFDVSLNLRLPKALLQGGVTTGREMFDSCDIVLELPERIAGATRVSADECRQQQPLLTQVKILGSYQLPWSLSVSGTYQNAYNATSTTPNINPGAPRMGINADYVATNAQIAPSLLRNLSSGSNATVNVVTPGALWGARLRQIDLRLTRTFRSGRLSTRAMFDVYNLLNTNTITAFNGNYGTNGAAWLTPVGVLPARLLKVGVQIDY